MKNWRYKIDGEELILSEAEHEEIAEGIRRKSSLIVLRGGTLAINPAFIRGFRLTERLTEPQESERIKTPMLPDGRRTSGGFLRFGDFTAATHEEFWERMGWEHGENCGCRKTRN
ncbi:MAG: hypothetical protein KGI72_05270 [Patescibacteria group bacterium]|nr:hypothetical protein [Patescibacteria group bacterium]MDE2233071.1 hypothetical protein [Patescibacteria group bacterium]